MDLVLHGDAGPMSRWASAVREGDTAALYGPDTRYDGHHHGLEFRPPEGTGTVLIAGDETAVPTICAILERLPAGIEGRALMG